MYGKDQNGQISFKDANYVKPKYQSPSMKEAMTLDVETNSRRTAEQAHELMKRELAGVKEKPKYNSRMKGLLFYMDD